MKQIIAVDIKTRKVVLSQCKTDMLVLGRFSDVTVLDKAAKALDDKLGGAIARLAKLGDFSGKAGSSAVVYGDDKIPAQRVLLLGLGEQKKATLDTIRKAAATAANKAVGMKLRTLSLALHSGGGRHARRRLDGQGDGRRRVLRELSLRRVRHRQNRTVGSDR